MVVIMKSYDFILLRGLAREGCHWGQFVERLEQEPFCAEIHTIDLPGNGIYHKLTSPIQISEMAEFVHAKVQEHSQRSHKVLFAISLGAMVGLEILQRYNTYQRAFFLNTSVSNLSKVYHRLNLKVLKSFYKILTSRDEISAEKAILEMVSNHDSKRQQVLQNWVKLNRLRRTTHGNALRQLIAASTFRLGKNRPTTPIHLLVSEDDRMVSSQCSKDLAKYWNLPLNICTSGAGHELTLDDPEWVLNVVRESLGSQLESSLTH